MYKEANYYHCCRGNSCETGVFLKYNSMSNTTITTIVPNFGDCRDLRSMFKREKIYLKSQMSFQGYGH